MDISISLKSKTETNWEYVELYMFNYKSDNTKSRHTQDSQKVLKKEVWTMQGNADRDGVFLTNYVHFCSPSLEGEHYPPSYWLK